jgi:hypothetical protein
MSEEEKNASLCLNNSLSIMNEMSDENFSIQRINDSLKEAENLFNAQVVLLEKGRPADFGLITPYCEQIALIRDQAFEIRDSFNALKKFYSDSLNENMNTSSVDKLIEEIGQEIESERYEKASPLIDEAYQEIINVQATQTNLNLFYKSTTMGIKDFLMDNKYIIIAAVLVIITFLLGYRRTINRWSVERKLSRLEIRKKTLRELVMQTQKEYFKDGKISDGIYSIRTKKFAEMIRDIDKEIPLLKEELIKCSGGIKI